MISWLSLFFFYCYADHRDLHSFPTRRSSDLRGPAVVAAAFHAGLDRELPEPTSLNGAGLLVDDVRGHHERRVDKPHGLPRSEEHTSELQISYAVFCLKKKKEIEGRYSLVQQF